MATRPLGRAQHAPHTFRTRRAPSLEEPVLLESVLPPAALPARLLIEARSAPYRLHPTASCCGRHPASAREQQPNARHSPASAAHCDSGCGAMKLPRCHRSSASSPRCTHALRPTPQAQPQHAFSHAPPPPRHSKVGRVGGGDGCPAAGNRASPAPNPSCSADREDRLRGQGRQSTHRHL